jgi:hypothetical protein
MIDPSILIASALELSSQFLKSITRDKKVEEAYRNLVTSLEERDVISTVSGLVTNIFLHLVYNPAEKANERLEHTCMLIMEEERREAQRKEDLQLLERLDEADIKEYIKQRLFKHIPSAELPPAEGISGKVEKRSRSQKPL